MPTSPSPPTRRARRYESDVARFRRWPAAGGGNLALIEIRSKLGLPTRFVIVERLPSGNERIVSRHRKRTAAHRRLQRLAKTLTAQPTLF